MNKLLLSHFNRIERHHWWWMGRKYLIKQLVKGQNPKKILDIGCGTGQTLKFIKTIYPQANIFGIDSSPTAVRFAKSRNLTNITLGTAYKLPYKNNTFDLILLLDVLEHIKDDELALKEAKRVLKLKGSIIITAPALPFIWSDHDSNQGHFRRYTYSRLNKLAVTANLHLAFLSYFNFLLSPFIIIIRLASKLPLLKTLSSYDSSLNYDIANKSIINNLLTIPFCFEIKLLNWIRYPFGISLVAKLIKKT